MQKGFTAEDPHHHLSDGPSPKWRSQLALKLFLAKNLGEKGIPLGEQDLGTQSGSDSRICYVVPKKARARGLVATG